MRRERGFSMVKSLVAMPVQSIAMLAAFRAFGSGAEVAGSVQDRTLAEIVALNRAAEPHLDEAPPRQLGSRRWRVTTARVATRDGLAGCGCR